MRIEMFEVLDSFSFFFERVTSLWFRGVSTAGWLDR